jgi:selenide,water dikinase
VYRLGPDLALVVTLDFFPPIVDDPYLYGAIAAANSMSDVYAMGAEVKLALNITCLSGCLPPEVIGEILRGGAEKVAEAGAVIAGGHSIEDKEPKYGLVAIGFAHPDRILTKAGARPGDALVLTKPLGVGIVTTAFKADQIGEKELEESARSMARLSRAASRLLVAGGARAATDVTGFSLLGHSWEMAEGSAATFRICAGALPFVQAARGLADLWVFPGGTATNCAAYSPHVRFHPSIEEELQRLLFTPETSGGILAAVPPEGLDAVRASFETAREPFWTIGEVLPSGDGGPQIEVVP